MRCERFTFYSQLAVVVDKIPLSGEMKSTIHWYLPPYFVPDLMHVNIDTGSDFKLNDNTRKRGKNKRRQQSDERFNTCLP